LGFELVWSLISNDRLLYDQFQEVRTYILFHFEAGHYIPISESPGYLARAQYFCLVSAEGSYSIALWKFPGARPIHDRKNGVKHYGDFWATYGIKLIE
jgi:hypothetical protein